MDNWLASITQWFHDLAVSMWNAYIGWFHDIWYWWLKTWLGGIASVIEAIDAPCITALCGGGVGFTAIFSHFPPYVLYVFNQLDLHTPLSYIAFGFTFRMIRKAVTLFQW